MNARDVVSLVPSSSSLLKQSTNSIVCCRLCRLKYHKQPFNEFAVARLLLQKSSHSSSACSAFWEAESPVGIGRKLEEVMMMMMQTRMMEMMKVNVAGVTDACTA